MGPPEPPFLNPVCILRSQPLLPHFPSFFSFLLTSFFSLRSFSLKQHPLRNMSSLLCFSLAENMLAPLRPQLSSYQRAGPPPWQRVTKQNPIREGMPRYPYHHPDKQTLSIFLSLFLTLNSWTLKLQKVQVGNVSILSLIYRYLYLFTPACFFCYFQI